MDRFNRNIKNNIEAGNLDKALESLNHYKNICISGLFNSFYSYKSYILPRETTPDYYYAYIGKFFYNLGQYKKALDCFNQAIELNPNRTILYCNKAKILNILELEEEANACLQQAFKISKYYPIDKSRYDYHYNDNHILCYIPFENYEIFKEYIPKGEELVLKNLAKLQKITARAQKVVDKLTPNKLKIKEAIEQFKVLKKSKISITIKIVDNFEKGINKEEEVNLLKELKEARVEQKMMEQRLHDLLHDVQEEKEATTIKIHKLQTEINIIKKAESEARETLTEGVVYLTKKENLIAKRVAIIERKINEEVTQEEPITTLYYEPLDPSIFYDFLTDTSPNSLIQENTVIEQLGKDIEYHETGQ
ncbi:MAG TPA: tetratricopeptide repeat protein [Rickettsia endosymbiont of Omalisus fontisbellaquei]|nr:tetratricopeptide repeat protein [Rickettsia endosymbiont of Omalisus fontisbellaquei]